MIRNNGIINILKETGSNLLDEGKTLRIRAEGFSMYPSIKPGSVILIEPCLPPLEPEKGEIIAGRRDSGFVVHRLVRIIMQNNERFFITRGDSARSEDLPVAARQLAGRVIGIESRYGKAVRIINDIPSPSGYFRNRLLARLALRKTILLKIIQNSKV